MELGVLSRFQRERGFYADALGLATVVLASGWEDRLRPLLDEEGRIVANCLDIYDVAVSKLVAGREKDLDFLESALASELIGIEQLLDRLQLVKSKVENDTLADRLGRLSARLKQAMIHGASIEAIKAFS